MDGMQWKANNGKRAPLNVLRCIKNYNSYIGGIDHVDQIRNGGCGVDDDIGRTPRWTFILYCAFVGLIMANSI